MDVAGTYRGELTLTVTDAPGYDPMRGTADMTVTAIQTGRQVQIHGTITWPGEEPTVIWDGVMGTVDDNGVWHGAERENDYDADCGEVRYGDRRIAFGRGTFSFRLQADTELCGRFQYRASLERL